MITSRPDAHCEIADIEQMLLQGEIPGDSGRSWLCAACGKDTNLWWAMVVCTWHMEIPPAWDSYPVQPFPSQWSVWPTNHCDGTSLLIFLRLISFTVRSLALGEASSPLKRPMWWRTKAAGQSQQGMEAFFQQRKQDAWAILDADPPAPSSFRWPRSGQHLDGNLETLSQSHPDKPLPDSWLSH